MNALRLGFDYWRNDSSVGVARKGQEKGKLAGGEDAAISTSTSNGFHDLRPPGVRPGDPDRKTVRADQKAPFDALQNVDFISNLKEVVGRVDSNHRPPGPEPWDTLFCLLLQLVANHPYSPVFFVFSMTSIVSALHRLARCCRLSLHEKGKKRAMSLFSVPLHVEFCSLVGGTFGHLTLIVQSRFKCMP